MGLRLLELAGEQRIAAQRAQRPNGLSAGKDGRALAIEPHVTARAGEVWHIRLTTSVWNIAARSITTLSRRSPDSGCLIDKAAKRADDLADAFMYAVLRCLGDGRTGRWDRLKRVA